MGVFDRKKEVARLQKRISELEEENKKLNEVIIQLKENHAIHVSQLKDRKYKSPLTMDIPYKNIDDKAVNELLRIFGNNCIEVSND